MEHDGLQIRAFEVKHLPIVSAFARKLGLVDQIDGQIKGEMDVSPGRVVLAMILDAPSSRSFFPVSMSFLRIKIQNCCLASRLTPPV